MWVVINTKYILNLNDNIAAGYVTDDELVYIMYYITLLLIFLTLTARGLSLYVRI